MDKFDVGVTNFFKGIACCLILSHHLFFNNASLGLVLTKIGVYSKVCVAMFCLLSGYGLAVSSRTKSLKEFYVVRLSKLYLGFWSIAVVFIPISWLGFNLGVHQVFSGDHVWLKFISQLLGLQQYYGGVGFSGPWGFMSIILTLYLFFPLLDLGCRRHPALTFIFCVAFLFAPVFMAHWPLPFFLGIYFAKQDLFVAWSRITQGRRLKRMSMLALMAFTGVLVVVARQKTPFIRGLRFDGIFACWIILSGVVAFDTLIKSRGGIHAIEAMSYLGKHSMNIFLLHSFLLIPLNSIAIFQTKNPVLIYLLLLISSLVCSIGIEKLKTLVGIPNLEASIRNAVHKQTTMEPSK